MLLEIHIIQNHSPANLNRDDLGAPKTAIFGGFPRARISSQCLKRSIRTSGIFAEGLKDYIGKRTRSFPALVQEALRKSSIESKQHKQIVDACLRIAAADREEAEATDEEARPEDELVTDQLIHLAPEEAERFVKQLEKLQKEKPELFKKFLKEPCPKKPTEYTEVLRQAYPRTGADIALFGRMTTSPAFEDVEAAMQVAHAISTHEVALEVDYFTAVDDDPRGRQGAGLVKENQFLSATFYKYFSLHWEGLLDNLGGDVDLAKRTVQAFINAAAKAVPTGKRNSHAHNNLPSLVVVEVKDESVPANYANAFVAPARPRTDRDGDHDLVEESIRMLAQHVGETRKAYGIASQCMWFAPREKDRKLAETAGAKPVKTLEELITASVGALDDGKE